MEVTTNVSTDNTVVLNEGLSIQNIRNYSVDAKKEGFKEVRRCIDGQYSHKNYLNYLEMAWASHHGVVISPDILWHIISSELASHIKDNADFYAELFTTTPGQKQNIIIPTGDTELIDLLVIRDELIRRIPMDANLFLPKFSTTTLNSEFAFAASFADAMQVYYNYMMFCCGISKIKVLGTDSDWDILISNVTEIGKKLTKLSKTYISSLVDTLLEVKVNRTPEFWSDMFYLENCGSGHQTEVTGWINNLFMKVPSVRYVENYSSVVSVVPYTNITTNKSYEVSYGLFSSNIEDDFLVPDFGYIINEKI